MFSTSLIAVIAAVVTVAGLVVIGSAVVVKTSVVVVMTVEYTSVVVRAVSQNKYLNYCSQMFICRALRLSKLSI